MSINKNFKSPEYELYYSMVEECRLQYRTPALTLYPKFNSTSDIAAAAHTACSSANILPGTKYTTSNTNSILQRKPHSLQHYGRFVPCRMVHESPCTYAVRCSTLKQESWRTQKRLQECVHSSIPVAVYVQQLFNTI